MSFGNGSGRTSGHLSLGQISLMLFGLAAPILTFVLAVSAFSESIKIFVLALLAIVYAMICFWAFNRSQSVVDENAADESAKDIETDLRAIGEASEFFGSSLKPADLFRLVSSRVDHVFPFANCGLFVASESEETLFVAQADGPDAKSLVGLECPTGKGIAGMAWVSRDVEIDNDLALDTDIIGGVTNCRSAAAIPLMHDGQVFAVLVLYTDRVLEPDAELVALLHEIGSRVAPLFLSSISFERSVSNALTDPITRLPNERAFYMVLENQLAESQRFRSERPLTVLTIDIKNFGEVNQALGFSVGDGMLAFAAENLASQLRKMDFLARSSSDEFLVILPTANEKMAEEIIRRIQDRFAECVYKASDSDEIKVWLNFGWATFWRDGETAEQLLQTARIRKQQSKAEEPSKVIWFPKEYVN